MKISYLIILVYFAYLGLKSFRAIQAKQRITGIKLIGYSDYKRTLLTVINIFFIPFLITLDSMWKYVLIVVLFIPSMLIDRVYLGDNGIKINDEFIPKQNILNYAMVDGSVNQFELLTNNHENMIKVTINKRTIARPIEEVLDNWKVQSEI